MKTFLITGYTFQELFENFQNKLIDEGKTKAEINSAFEKSFLHKIIENRVRERIDCDYQDESNNEIQLFEEETLKNLGYEDANVVYSGFCSQGDGLCFDGTINVPIILKRIKDTDIVIKAQLKDKNEKLFELVVNNIIKFNYIKVIIRRPCNIPQPNYRIIELDWDEIYFHDDAEVENPFSIDECNDFISKIAEIVYHYIKREYEETCSKFYKKLEDLYYSLGNEDSVKKILMEEDNVYYDKYGSLICNLEFNDIPSIDIDGRKNPSDPNGNVLSLNIVL